jgi:DNA-binding transcriptional ArsR family regulator
VFGDTVVGFLLWPDGRLVSPRIRLEQTSRTMTDVEVAARERLRQLVNGYQVTQAIHVAIDLGLPDLLAAGPRSASDLAAQTGSHHGSLYRLLRAITSVGLLRTSGDGGGRQFELTELGHLLRTDGTGSLAGWAALVGRPYTRSVDIGFGWSVIEATRSPDEQDRV